MALSDTDRTTAAEAGLKLVVSLLIIIPVSTVYGGFVFESLWNWFAEPLTRVHLGLWQAAGLSTLLSFLKLGLTHGDKDETLTDVVIRSWLLMGTLLAIGWAAHSLGGGQ